MVMRTPSRLWPPCRSLVHLALLYGTLIATDCSSSHACAGCISPPCLSANHSPPDPEPRAAPRGFDEEHDLFFACEADRLTETVGVITLVTRRRHFAPGN